MDLQRRRYAFTEGKVATMASESKTGMAAQKNGKHEMKWELI